jgi:hypothetical protein
MILKCKPVVGEARTAVIVRYIKKLSLLSTLQHYALSANGWL